MRYLMLLMMICPTFLWAQSTVQPQVSAEDPSEPVIVGQPAIVRIKVLVPTYMPSPPVFPSLEQENLLVRLPERASGPISETVDGETWSGVQRSYRLYPLQPGTVEFGAQDVAVTYADPTTNAPIEISVPLPKMALTAIVPDAARDLDPLILATEFTVEQQIDGETEMDNGAAITRRLTAKISGTTPLIVPELIPDIQDPLLRSYLKEPRFIETEDRGVLSGQRVDENVYLAQQGGQTQLPPISIQWYNLDSKQVETIEIDPVALTLAPPKWQPPDARTILTYVIWTTGLGLLLWAAYRQFSPRLRQWNKRRHDRYHQSANYALQRLKKALQDNDLPAAYSALDLWKSRSSTPANAASLEDLLVQIGAVRYSAHDEMSSEPWATALAELKNLNRSEARSNHPLPPLNPFGQH